MQAKQEARAPHRLLITYTVQGDLVRGNNFLVTLSVTNIGDKAFPGGTFATVRIDYNVVTSNAQNLPAIPRLELGGEGRFGFTLGAPNDGFGWIVAKIVANDGQPVEHYQSREFSLGSEWRNALFISRPEDEEVIALLEKIASLLEARRPKG